MPFDHPASRTMPLGPPAFATRRALCSAILAIAGLVAATGVRAAPVETIIRGARVLDGTGAPWIRADVAFSGDRISRVGIVPQTEGAIEIDGSGLYLVPGFIDPHTHAASGLLKAELSGGRVQLAQGVTTVFVNPDGGGPADLTEQRRLLEGQRPGINVAQLVPHGSVRTVVMGRDDRDPTEREMQAMKDLVEAGMQAGAFGLSAGTAYVPGMFSKTGEHVELARVAAAHGGFYTSHIRSEGAGGIGLVAAVEEVITVAREAGLPGVITHIKALGPGVHGFSTTIVSLMDAARAEGVEMWADQYPYEASSTGLAIALPDWAQEGGDAAVRARLADDALRSRIRPDFADNIQQRGGPGSIQIARFVADPTFEGMRLDEIARSLGQEWEDTGLDIIARGGATMVSFNMDAKDVETFMRQSWTMTCSDGTPSAPGDGVPHPRAYGAFPRKLRRHVIERGTVTLEQAIHSMTGLTATALRVADRGFIREGAFADLVLIDLERVRDMATYERPHEYAEGVVNVWVNGVHAWRGSEPTGARAGRVLSRKDPG